MVNPICLNCKHFGAKCSGTKAPMCSIKDVLISDRETPDYVEVEK